MRKLFVDENHRNNKDDGMVAQKSRSAFIRAARCNVMIAMTEISVMKKEQNRLWLLVSQQVALLSRKKVQK